MAFDVTGVIKKCATCQAHKPALKSTAYATVKPHYVWHSISIDVIGPLPPCSSKHQYIIIAVDGLTKWVEAKPIRVLVLSLQLSLF